MTSQIPARYFVFTRAGRAIVSVERDIEDMGRNSTISDLIGGQIDNPVSVWCAEDNRFYDATDEICQEIADYSASQCEPIRRQLIEWIESHLGTLVANELKAA